MSTSHYTTMTTEAKRKALSAVADYQMTQRCTRFEACLDLRLPYKHVERWTKELGTSVPRGSVELAISLYDEKRLSISEAARRALVPAHNLTNALQARGRREYTTPHISAHNRGHASIAY